MSTMETRCGTTGESGAGPQAINLPVYRGDSFGFQVRVWLDVDKTVPADLAPALVSAEIRDDPNGALLAVFLVDTETNVITLTLLPEQTAALPQRSVFDVQVDWYSDGQTSVQTVLRGVLATAADVSRPAPEVVPDG